MPNPPLVVTATLAIPDEELVERFVRDIFIYNPFSGILELYRAGFFPAGINWVSVAAAVVGTALSLAVGGFVFARLERAVLKEI